MRLILLALVFAVGDYKNGRQMSMVHGDKFDEDNYGVKYADECEVCKIVSEEFETLLGETAAKHEVLETGYSIEKAKKKTKYVTSELRLIETVDKVCAKLLEYNIHKERKDVRRFARGTSETFQALDNLVAKGVKVDIGIPKELWHKPSAEITDLKTKCEGLLERHEEDIETWYFNHQHKSNLEEFLCRKKALMNKDTSCLNVKGEGAGKSAPGKKKADKKKKKKKTEL